MTRGGATEDSLQRLAEAVGILPRWHHLSGAEQTTGPETQRALLAAMGFAAASDTEAAETLQALATETAARRIPREIVVEADAETAFPLTDVTDWRLELEQGGTLSGTAAETATIAPPAGLHRLVAGDQSCLVIAAPKRAPAVSDLLSTTDDGPRPWGVTGALYGLHSDRNLGVGDYRDLGDACRALGTCGAQFFGINPIHASGVMNDDVSPYAPTCRTALEPRHIAVDCIPGFADCKEAQRLLHDNAADLVAAREGDEVAYAIQERIQPQILRALFKTFNDTGRTADFDAWRQARGPALERFARFEAISQRHGADWRRWPQDLQAVGSAAVGNFAGEHAAEIRYHAWLQWLAENQVGNAQTAARQAGMGLGLYLDLAVGVRPGSADTWADPDCFAKGVSLGAPPDGFNPQGQVWNLSPFNIPALRKAGYRPFIETLRGVMRHAGIIRIDHILGINRGFWVPDSGAPGGYVTYPMESLLALVKLEAARASCIVVGEDLGSVPEGLRGWLAEAGLLGCAVLQFEKEGDRFRDPCAYAPSTLASFGTHDMPTMRGWWRGSDTDLRRDTGQISDEAQARGQQERSGERAALLRLLEDKGLLAEGSTLEEAPVTALHRLLAGAGSDLVAVQMDDALGSLEQQNLPGTVSEYPNWRRRYRIKVENLGQEPGFAAIAEIFNAAASADATDTAAEKEKQPWM